MEKKNDQNDMYRHVTNIGAEASDVASRIRAQTSKYVDDRRLSREDKLQEELEQRRDEISRIRFEAAQLQVRESKLVEFLKNLCEGIRLQKVEVPGYEDAASFLMEEQLLKKGGSR